MAAPEDKSPKNLNGVWILNKTESDPTDPVLQLQGINWFIRKAIGLMTVTLIITQTHENGATHIITKQPGAGGVSGTTERRHLFDDNHIEESEHTDHIFGHVKGHTKWIKLEELSDTDEDEKWLKEGWLESDVYIDTFVTSQDSGWTARQIWGFAEVESNGQKMKKFVRRAVVKKGNQTKRARLIHDFKEELREPSTES